MPHQKLTQALVERLPYHDKTVWYHDADLPGFNLSVGQQSKTLYACGEHKRKFVRVKIGRCDVTKVNEARAVAQNVLLPELRRGVDPRARPLSDEDRASDHANILAGIRMARPEDLTDGMANRILRGKAKSRADELTVGQVWEKYQEFRLASILEEHGPAKARRAETHIMQQRQYLGGGEKYGKDGPCASTLEFPKGWWDRPITSITPELCSKTWRSMTRTRGKRSAQMFFLSVHNLFTYAVAKKEVPITASPLVIDLAGDGIGLPKGWQTLVPQKKLDRISDLRAWWQQVDQMTVIPKSALKVMLLTAMRPSEVLKLRWDQIDLEAGKVVWRDQTKGIDGYQERALSTWTVAQLERLARYTGKREYVFQGPTGGRLQEIPNVTRGKDTWTPGQPRKEWRTTAAEINVNSDLAEMQQGHKLKGVKSSYIVTPDLRATVQQVADAIMEKVKGAV
jgi:integrase